MNASTPLRAINRFLLLLTLFCTFALPAKAQVSDLAKLVHPDVAERISLTDPQRTEIQKLLQSRAEALATAKDTPAKEAARRDFEEKILALLTPEQKELFASLTPSQKLTFQFREMKWDDVLQWFAEQQDLTLVMDRTPPGVFTYSDSRTYSPAEGIDLLNSVLMTRNFTLVRREKMLVVMELSDSLPLELIPRVKSEELVKRGRFELVSVVFPLGGRPIDNVLNEVKPYLSNYGRVVPLAQGTQVLVVETAGKMQTINELIASVPIPKATPKPEPTPPPVPLFTSYPLGSLDAERVLKTIQTLIPSERITVDPKTGILSAFVIPDQHTAIKSALDQMLASATDLPGNETVAYQASKTIADDFRKQIVAIAPNASFVVAANRVLVTASAEDQKVVREALAGLDIHPVVEGRWMKVFEIDPAIASATETAMKGFLPNAQVAASSAAGSLIVRGTDQDLQLAAEILELWKRSQTNKSLQLRAFPLDRVADSKWLSTVQKIIPEASVWLSADGKQLMLLANQADSVRLESTLPPLLALLPQPSDRQLKVYILSKIQLARRTLLTTEMPETLSTMKIVDGTSKQELMVWGSPEQHIQFATFLESLDQPGPTPVPVVAKIYPLQVEDSSLVVQILTAEFPDAKITAATVGDSLTVIADDVTQKKLADRLTAIVADLPKKREMKLQSYSVAGMTASALNTALTPLLTNARVNVDATKNRLLITADAKTHTDIQSLVQALDANATADQQKIVVVYPVQHATPTQIKTILDQLLVGTVILADDKLKQVIATGTIEAQATAKATIEQMDRPKPTGNVREIRTYDTKKVQATYLLPVLQKLWPEMELAADTTANKIIASGSADDLVKLGQAMERLVAAPDGSPQSVQTYAVPAGDMLTLASILGQIAPQAIISTDATSRTVTAWANEEQHQRIAQALEQISKTAQSAKVPATYIVKPTQVLSVQTALQSLFPSASVAGIATTGQLIVVTTDEQQKRIAQVIEMLASGSNGADRTIRVFRLDPERMDTTSAITGLQAVLPSQIRLEPNTASNTILAIGTPEELNVVATKLDEVQKQLPTPEPSTTVVYPLAHGTPAGAYALLTSLLPRTTIIQDATSKTIAATGTRGEHEKIREVLATYDIPRQDPLETQVYRLKQGSAYGLASVLVSLMPQAAFYGGREDGVLVATATKDQHQRIQAIVAGYDQGTETRYFPIAMADPTALARALSESYPKAKFGADATNGGLFATSSDGELEAIAKIIAEVNQQPGKLPSFRAFPLKHASAEAIAKSVTGALGSRSTTGVTFQRDANTVFAVGSKQDLTNIEQLIAQLDTPESRDNARRLEIFSLKGVDGKSISTTLESLFKDSANPAEIKYDSFNEQLFVAGDAKQLALIADSLQKLAPPKRELAIFQLEDTDPNSFKFAADALFADEPLNTTPSITIDYNQQQALVRGTKEQIESIRKLVSQLGEPDRAEMSKVIPGSNANSRLRFVPIHRNPKGLLEDVERLWPMMRGNPIQVIDPKAINKKPADPPPAAPPQGDPKTSALRIAEPEGRNRFVATQPPADPAPEQPPSLPPVIIVAGENQWTIASDDPEAVARLEQLLTSLLNPVMEPYATAGTYSVYILRHADAKQLAELLQDLFKTSERGSRTTFSEAMQRIKIVADERINALVIGGNRADRKIIEELLGVFDSKDLIDRLQRITPILVPLQSASAKNVSDIVKEVYKSQLSSGSGRDPLDIPEGVSSDVATILQQINAQSSTPLLTLSVDDSSNTLVLRGASELTEEVKAFISSLDQQAASAPARRIQVLRLESTNSKNLEKAMKLLYGK